MVEFAAVLAEVEARERDEPPVARAFRFGPAVPESPMRKGSAREAAGAYAETASRRRQPLPQRKPTPPDRTAVFAEIATARGNVLRLRALRRRLALRLHPDRAASAADAKLMAEFNAAIDAALKE